MALKPEQIEHINVYNWFCNKFPELAEDFHHFANERKTSFFEGRILKRMGVKKGVADFFLAFPAKKYHGLWIELKVKGGVLSREQKSFLSRKALNGYFALCAWGEEEAKEIILEYLSSYMQDRHTLLPRPALQAAC